MNPHHTIQYCFSSLFWSKKRENPHLMWLIELVYHEFTDRVSIVYTAQKSLECLCFLHFSDASLNSVVHALFTNSIILTWYQLSHLHPATRGVTRITVKSILSSRSVMCMSMLSLEAHRNGTLSPFEQKMEGDTGRRGCKHAPHVILVLKDI